eukprot:scaffold9990_cov99-Isochrysis_galbana.AAC.2
MPRRRISLGRSCEPVGRAWSNVRDRRGGDGAREHGMVTHVPVDHGAVVWRASRLPIASSGVKNRPS